MAFQDVYELIDFQQLYGQAVLNVYFYQNNNVLQGDASAEDLVTSWIAQVLPDIQLIQSADILHNEVSARNLFNEADNFSQAISEVGDTAGDSMSSFNAVGFALVQDNGAIRNGAKRIAGILEAAAVDGVITDTNYIDNLSILGDQIADVLTLDALDTFVPVIVQRILDGGAYRLPESFGEAVLGAVLEGVFNVLITSQTSRKVGVGI
jgi:hypothetical protein